MSELPRCTEEARLPVLRLFDSEAESDTIEQEADDGRTLSADLTVPQFYARYVAPIYLRQRHCNAKTLIEYQTSIDYWAEHSGNPPLRRVDEWAATEFISALYRLPGRKKDRTLSPFTIRKHVQNLQTVLDLAGPRTREHPKAQRLLDEVPRLDRPQCDGAGNEHDFTLAEIEQQLGAADAMPQANWPREHPGGAWWRALIITTYNVGERRGAMLCVERPCTRPEDLPDRLAFPRGIRKGQTRSHLVPLNAAARAAIASVWCLHARLFAWEGWPNSARWFHEQWQRLLVEAGLPPERRFGLHGLRKSAATAAARINPLAAQLLLGHTDFKTTQQHYINPGILAQTMAQLPQPAAPAARDPQRLLFE